MPTSDLLAAPIILQMPGMGYFLAGIILLIIGFVALVFLVTGIILLYSGYVHRKWGKQVGGIALTGIALWLGYSLFGNSFKSMDAKARSDMALPPEAHVVHVNDDDNLSIDFTLPPTHLPEEWLDIVFQANRKALDEGGAKPSDFSATKEAYHRTLQHHQNRMEVDYSPASQQYRFSVYFDN